MYEPSLAAWGRQDACQTARCSEPNECDLANGNEKILCWARECAVPYAECRSEPDCVRYESCQEPCAAPDLECHAACHVRYPKGYTLYEAYFSCIAARCLL
jgi:hypothetical protein